MKNFSSVVVRENFASQQKGKKLSVSLSLFFLSHYTRPADDCVTSDRSVDELLMRSHFSTLHRRLSKRGRFPVCHQCSPLCYKAFFLHSPASTHFHIFKLFLLALSRLDTELASEMCENVCTKSLSQLKWKNTELE